MNCKKYQFIKLSFQITLIFGMTLGSLCLIASVMLFDSGTYSFEKFKSAVLVGPFFFYFVIADIIFYILYKGKKKFKQAFLAFLLPFILETIVYGWLIFGPLPGSVLPPNDYRHFYGTQAYELVSAIEHQKEIEEIDIQGVNYQDSITGMTPLLFCIRNEYYEDAISLVKMGADPNTCCTRTLYSPLLELCCEINGDTTVSVVKNQLIKHLIDYGANINYCISNTTPLMGLCSSKNTELSVFKYMLKHGADLNIKFVQEDEYLHDCYKENEMALNMALYREKYEVVALFLDNSPDTTDYGSWLANTMCRKKRNLDCLTEQEKKTFEFLESYFLSSQ